MYNKSLLALCLILFFSNFANASKRPPFLIMGMIPHMTMQVKQNWNNEELALNENQKTELLKIRKETMSSVIPLKKQIAPLEKEVASKILSGSKPNELLSLVNKIAALKTEATQVHLTCVYKTQKVLSKKQLEVLNNL